MIDVTKNKVVFAFFLFFAILILLVTIRVAYSLDENDVCNKLNLTVGECNEFWNLFNRTVYITNNITQTITYNNTVVNNYLEESHYIIENNYTNNITLVEKHFVTNNITVYRNLSGVDDYYTKDIIDQKVANVKLDTINTIIIGNLSHLITGAVDNYFGDSKYITEEVFLPWVEKINLWEQEEANKPEEGYFMNPLILVLVLGIIALLFYTFRGKLKGMVKQPQRQDNFNIKDMEKASMPEPEDIKENGIKEM